MAVLLHGIEIFREPDPARRFYLGDSGTIEINGITYTVYPNTEGGANLHGTGPRLSPYAEGGSDWQHYQLEMLPNGEIYFVCAVIGKVVDGIYQPYDAPRM